MISTCCIEFNKYKTRITVLQYCTTLSNLITSFCIIFDICYMMNQQHYIYSRILQVLISTCCNQFNHYKTWITLLQYSTALSSVITSFCIIFDICYMMNLAFYIYSRILPVLISKCCIEFNNYKTRITVLQYFTTLSSIITSFCVIFNICYMMNQLYYIYSSILQVLFQHAALNLITTKREFTPLQYSTTLSSVITSFCIIFDICYMMNQLYYIYSSTLQVLFQHAALNLITTKREFTPLQYSTTLLSIITSFCVIFDICYMMNQQYYIYSRILPVIDFNMLYWI